MAVVTIGDADELLRSVARAAEATLEANPALLLPGDLGVREALRGEPGPPEDDGLGAIRRDRRALEGDAARAGRALSALGRRVGAVAIVAVQRRGAAIEAVVLDVATGRLFEGDLPLPSAELTRFVTSRARASARRLAFQPGETRADAPSERGPREARRGRTRPDPEPRDEDEDDEPSFLEKAWPYFVAGILLVAVVTYAVVSTSADDPASPVLRFLPGGR